MPAKLTNRNADLSSSDLAMEDSNNDTLTPERVQETLAHFGKEVDGPDYREMVDRRNAVTLFDCYIDIFETMIEIEPKLFKDTVKTMKKHRTFHLNIDKMKAMKRLYPDLIPNVFTRLWKQDYEPVEQRHRMLMFRDAKLAWRKRLRD